MMSKIFILFVVLMIRLGSSTNSMQIEYLPAPSKKNATADAKNLSTTVTLCSTNCLLEPRVFKVENDHLLTANIKGFRVVVRIEQDNGNVNQTSTSYLRVKMIKSAQSNATVKLSTPKVSKAISNDGFWVPVKRNRANFFLNFMGSTMGAVTSSNGTVKVDNVPVTLEFTCPETVPAGVASKNGTAMTNPCYQYLSTVKATTMPIHVKSLSKFFDSNIVKKAKKSVKFALDIKSLKNFDARKFMQQLTKSVQTNASYITDEDTDSMFGVIVCEVQNSVFSDATVLDEVVCGSTNKCTAENATGCPNGVVVCICGAPAEEESSFLLKRNLLQDLETSLKAELSPDLQQASGYEATSDETIAAEYDKLISDMTTALKNNELMAGFSVNTSSINLLSAVTDPTSNTSNNLTSTSSASSSKLSAATTLLAFLVIFAIFF